MAKPKTLPAAGRKVIRQLAAALVCAEVEAKVIAPLFEEKTGKQYKYDAPNSYLNVFLDSDPEIRRAWKLMQKDIVSTRQGFADRVRRERDN